MGSDIPPADEQQQSARVDIAAVQFAPHTDTSANLAALTEQVCRAAERGAGVVVAPEYSMFATTRLDQRMVAAAQPLDGPFGTGLAELARRAGVHLVAGMVESAEPTEQRIYNTVVAFAPDGSRVASYRKVHLYDAFGQRESDIVRPGRIESPATFTANGVMYGLQTCFDLRFPESFRRVAAAGAHVLLLPAQWIPGPGKVDQWSTLLRARAMENTVYVAAPDHAAPRGAGTSMIIDPAGVVLAELSDEPGIALAEIDLARLARIRARNPSLGLRRFEIDERATE